MSRSSKRASEITFVANDIGLTGGMERQLRALIVGCLDDGRRVTVLSRSCDIPPHPALRAVHVPGPSRPLTLAHPSFEVMAGHLLQRERRGIVHACGGIVPNRVDVVAVHFCHVAYNALGAALRASRDTPGHRLNARMAAHVSALGERYSLMPSRVRAVVTVSRGVADELRVHHPRIADRATTIPHGVDPLRFAPNAEVRADVRPRWGIGNEALVALFVGGDWERKGLMHAIEATAAGVAWHLVVVGEGDEARYRAQASRLSCGDRVRFAGRSADPSRDFAAADAFLLPTRYETFSLVTFEAAASGLPLLVTPVSGPDELIVDGSNGYLLDRDPARTAALLQRLAADPSLRATLGASARRSIEPYTWEAAVEAHLALYDRLSAGSGPAHEGVSATRPY